MTFWHETLGLLETQINQSEPRLRLLSAHGLLFSAVVWLQSQMVRLLALKRCRDQCPSLAVSELWKYDDCRELRDTMLFPELRKQHACDFFGVAAKFRTAFCLSRDEVQALACVQCLHNMLAYGGWSIFQFAEAGEGPSLVHLPHDAKGHCFKCRPHLNDEKGNKGLRVDFDPGQLPIYFGDLRTVCDAVERTASRMGLHHEDLL